MTQFELNPLLVVNRTIIAQAGDFGRLLGRLDLELDSHTGKVVRYQGQLIPISEELPIDPSARCTMLVVQQPIGVQLY